MPNLQARRLRAQMTEGERRLWWLLRRKQLSGFRFRRQAKIGPYIADFFCPSAKLVIEVDGVPHADEERTYRDQTRTRWLEARGYRVIRFWNVDIFKRPVEATEAIYHALTHPPFRPFGAPSPSRGKGQNRIDFPCFSALAIGRLVRYLRGNSAYLYHTTRSIT